MSRVLVVEKDSGERSSILIRIYLMMLYVATAVSRAICWADWGQEHLRQRIAHHGSPMYRSVAVWQDLPTIEERWTGMPVPCLPPAPAAGSGWALPRKTV